MPKFYGVQIFHPVNMKEKVVKEKVTHFSLRAVVRPEGVKFGNMGSDQVMEVFQGRPANSGRAVSLTAMAKQSSRAAIKGCTG